MIAIISYGTHSAHLNYGATLHTYAFQQFLTTRGCQSIVIDYIADSLKGYHFKYPLLNDKNILNPPRFIYHLVNWTMGFCSNLRKFRKFQNFISEQFVKTQKSYTYSDLEQNTSIEGLDICVFVCESDVIWKFTAENKFDKGFLLAFSATNGKKKVAYAPSISSEPFTERQLSDFKYYIKDFQAISTREQEGAIYLSNILNKEIDWVLDPVFLLSAKDYSKLAIKPKDIHYVLVYNCTMNDQKMVKEAERFGKEKNLKVIEISNYSINKLLNHHEVVTDAGIEEWLGFLMHADYVICNGFHGFCFSVIFKKEVFLFLRNHSDYRMQNITRALGLEDRLIGLDDKRIPNEVTPINYDQIEQKLSFHIRKAKNYIEKNIENN